MNNYRVFIDPEAHSVRKELPGNFRQIIKHSIDDLITNPHPSNSRELNVKNLEIPDGVSLLRIRIGHWRIVYAVSEHEKWVWVLKISHRPPYNYEDLVD